eukprot:CAMPEP_0182439978 /NCGR_PEP_ID=MMETSP1167-20130531/86766_1 /TAXON_ID=2988 /ORGANISM="Mallomonas Sp, Strain CCMP3275" /LENGTH=313 /DNA_ID=CAMNT_0024633795 /DNA_START=46 /DNA_END=987 /DNA_ORIENTATION=-
MKDNKQKEEEEEEEREEEREKEKEKKGKSRRGARQERRECVRQALVAIDEGGVEEEEEERMSERIGTGNEAWDWRREREREREDGRSLSRREMSRRFRFGGKDWRAGVLVRAASQISPEARDAALQLCNNPDDILAGNALTHAVLNCPKHRILGELTSVERVLPVRYLFMMYPHHLIPCLLSAHELVAKKKPVEAVDRYLSAFCLSPNEPLISLCMSVQLTVLATCPIVKNRHATLLKAFVFILHYAALRKHEEEITTDVHDVNTTNTAPTAAISTATPTLTTSTINPSPTATTINVSTNHVNNNNNNNNNLP